MKTFQVPPAYRSPLISAVKSKRKLQDKMKKDFSPALLDFGPLKIYLARHFGFCYGVENAIEIAFRTVEENPGRRIFLLSEMIHNPVVNADLEEKGIRFLQDTIGNQLIPFSELKNDDIVIIPAFGTTLEMEARLKGLGISTETYNTTCPFVEKVWNRSEQIAEKGYTIVIHGKPKHEETRATFSHAASNAPSLVINDMDEARELAEFIKGNKSSEEFYTRFKGRYSANFDPSKHLQRIGVVNQTTQLATDTQAIADFLKQTIVDRYGPEDSFADTRDTLCYATNDNQSAVSGMLNVSADLAIIVGGYNSSNTTHLVELCEQLLPSYFINDEDKLISKNDILHYNYHTKQESLTHDYLPRHAPAKILITSGASCPDAVVERVIRKVASFFDAEDRIDALVREWS